MPSQNNLVTVVGLTGVGEENKDTYNGGEHVSQQYSLDLDWSSPGLK